MIGEQTCEDPAQGPGRDLMEGVRCPAGDQYFATTGVPVTLSNL